MRAGAPDVEALRALFTELEFTSLLKELLPVVEVTGDALRRSQVSGRCGSSAEDGLQRVTRSPWPSKRKPRCRRWTIRKRKPDEPQESMLPLTAAPVRSCRPHSTVAISAAAGTASDRFLAGWRRRRAVERSALENESVPKSVHDYKAAIHAFAPQGITLRGVRHDPMLYSYLLDPTYSSHRLPEVALRRFNLKLSGTLAESADVTGRFATALRQEVEAVQAAEGVRRN